MARTISFVKGKGSIRHNNRDFTASNVDGSRSSMNITYVKKTVEEAYDDIFGEALREYNAKQKRNDRKIDNYLEKVKTSKNNEKVFYETVVQIGKMDDTGILDKDGNITSESLQAKEILDEYARTFQERNPNLILFNAVLHMDEATPHLHLDYIPVAHGYKTGLSTRNSLSKGLQEMGIAPAIGKNDNETMHWQQREREFLTGICREHGMEIEILGVDRDDYSIPEYKAAMREKEAAEAEIEILQSEKVEIESALASSEITIVSNLEEIAAQEESLAEVNAKIKEADIIREAKEKAIGKIVKAEKNAMADADRIEAKAEIVKSIFDKEPMVKITRRDFDRLIDGYKTAGIFRRLYNEAEEKITALQGSVGRLKQQVDDLNLRVHQLTNFIRDRGLFEAFKAFIAPGKSAITTMLDEKKRQSAERDKIRREIMPEKKVRHDRAR